MINVDVLQGELPYFDGFPLASSSQLEVFRSHGDNTDKSLGAAGSSGNSKRDHFSSARGKMLHYHKAVVLIL